MLAGLKLNRGGYKIDIQKNFWNDIFKEYGNSKPEYDLWLDKYKHIFEKSKATPIIDLGCGFGNDTLYLSERSYDVISCDFSEEALKRLDYFITNPTVKLFNMKEGLPFEDKSAKVIISDLSLHYFYCEETKNIIKEIQRVLVDEGFLLCRVNSTKDINHGAGEGIELEENFYDIDGNLKRFFNEKSVRELFSGWEIEYISEYEMLRYKSSKIVWEIAARKL